MPPCPAVVDNRGDRAFQKNRDPQISSDSLGSILLISEIRFIQPAMQPGELSRVGCENGEGWERACIIKCTGIDDGGHFSG